MKQINRKTVAMVIFLLLDSSYNLFAQTGLLRLGGSLKDIHSGSALAGANLRLENGKEILRTSSDKNGDFIFKSILPGKYRLTADYIGYEPDTQTINLRTDTAIGILLKISNHQLAEVVVRSSAPPVVIRQDTIIFNADAFKNRPNAPVIELLRKLPGIVIDADGNITIHGQRVDKILIDGKTFFIDDLRKATRNLPADIIAQVQIYGSQSDENKLAGITENSTAKTVDLKLKKEKKDGWLGKLYTGYGNHDSYSAGGTVTKLGEKRMLSAELNTNNIFNQFAGVENNLPEAPAGNETKSGLSMNYKEEINKKLTVTAFGSVAFLRGNEQSSDDKQTFLPDSTLLSHSASAHTNADHSYGLGSVLTYKADGKTFIYDKLIYSSENTSNGSKSATLLRVIKNKETDTASNGNVNNSGLAGNSQFSNIMSLTRKFNKKNQALQIHLNLKMGSQQNSQDLYTKVLSRNPTDSTLVNQRSQNPVRTTDLNAGVEYSQPVGVHNILELDLSVAKTGYRSQKKAADYNMVTGAYDLPDTLTTDRFNHILTTAQAKISWSNLPGGRFFYKLYLGGQNFLQTSNDLSRNLAARYSDIALQPGAELRYNTANGKRVELHYAGYSQAPDIDQIQPIPDLSDPFLVKTGNPGLKESFVHKLIASYSAFASGSNQSLNISTSAELAQHPISGASEMLPGGVQQVEFVNLADIYHLSANIIYGFPLIRQDHGSGSLGAHYNFGLDRSRVNNVDNFNRSNGTGADLRINFHAADKLFADVAGSFSLVNNRYSLPGQNNNTGLKQDYNAGVIWVLPFSLTAGVYYALDLRHNTGLPDQQSGLLNASLAKDLFGGHNAQVSISGFNLLNTASAATQDSGPNFMEARTGNTPQRLLLLSFVYNFENLHTQ